MTIGRGARGQLARFATETDALGRKIEAALAAPTSAQPQHEDGGIPFTQFLMPQGRPSLVWITRPSEIEAKAKAIMAAGFRFECEMLSDYCTISFTITKDGTDYAIQLCANGPAVPEAVECLISTFSLTSKPIDPDLEV